MRQLSSGRLPCSWCQTMAFTSLWCCWMVQSSFKLGTWNISIDLEQDTADENESQSSYKPSPSSLSPGKVRKKTWHSTPGRGPSLTETRNWFRVEVELREL